VNTIVNVAQLIIALVLTNAGGEGKSTWAEILAALARLAGLDIVVADVDPGNRGYLNRNGNGSAVSLDWSPKTDEDPTVPADPADWYEAHLAGRQLAILDTGANMLAAANPIGQFIAALLKIAQSKGARIIVYAVTSPNKAGSDELVEMMHQRFHGGAEVVVVQNDRDGSKSFKASLATMGTPIVALPHLAPGLQEVRLRRCIPLHEVLSRPEPGYERATALIAKRLLIAARQKSVIDVIGRGAIAPLEQIAVLAPSAIHYQIARLGLAGNAAVTANETVAAAWGQFRRSRKGDEAAFLNAAHTLWDAEQEWHGRQP
jgi:hypothetical protein